MESTNAESAAPAQAAPPESGGSLRDEVAETATRLHAEVEQRKASAARLGKEARALAKAGGALAPLLRPAAWLDPRKTTPLLARIEKRLGPDAIALAGLGNLFQRLRDHVASGPARMRREFGRSIQEACRSRGLEFTVVSREPPIEVRIVPLSVVVDFEKGKADLRFARESLVTCPATVDAILDARARVLRSLDGSFSPGEFFRACRRAYLLALADREGHDGDRVEILDLLPLLAVVQQPKKFRVNPTAANFRPYPKAQFAYDVFRLAGNGGLAQGGLRLNLGVATGSTAHDKSRVIFIEDGRGGGEYKLTVFFTTAEGGDAR